jgi:hypothetical protein
MKRTKECSQIKIPSLASSLRRKSLRFGLFAFFVTLTLTGCSSLILKPADFSWPIEDELQVDQQGMIQENRYSLVLNVKPLLYVEMKDSVNLSGKTINIIRDMRGYYFLTGPQFKNVYVFYQADGSLKLQKKIAVSKTGLSAPAFNQRAPYIELISSNNEPLMLTKDGIWEEKK